MRYLTHLRSAILLLLLAALPARAAQRAGEEIRFPSKEFAKLDTFEGLNLEDGDRLFAKKDYKGAYAAYKAYSEDFPKGEAVAYALLRMGRCLHLLKKRNAAVRAYQEVVDYFPNAVRYAAGALYHMGQAYQENGDEKKCLATWARMVKDKEYINEPNSGTALVYLAREMEKAKEYEEAASYHWRIAVSFQVSNPTAAREAKEAVRFHYTVRAPDHEQFKTFYKEVGGWHRGEKLDDLENSPRYWDTAFDTVLRGHHGESAARQKLRIEAAPYWVKTFGAKFPDHDHLQTKAIDLRLMTERDSAAWVSRMNAQAAKSELTLDRLIWWVRAFTQNPKAQGEFLGQHNQLLAGATAEQVAKLIDALHPSSRSEVFVKHLAPGIQGMKTEDKMTLLASLTRHRMVNEARSVLNTVDLNGLSDKDLATLAGYGGDLLGEEGAMRYFDRMKSKADALVARYQWYVRKSNYDGRHFNQDLGEKALALMPQVAKSPEHAQATLWPKARILHRMGKLEDAIKAYKNANRQPDSTWKVVECQVGLKDYANAIKSARGLESIGGGVAAQACLKIADIYRVMADKTKEVEQLRLVLHRYPGSSQSSTAHQRLEDYGAKITGGQAEAKE